MVLSKNSRIFDDYNAVNGVYQVSAICLINSVLTMNISHALKICQLCYAMIFLNVQYSSLIVNQKLH